MIHRSLHSFLSALKLKHNLRAKRINFRSSVYSSFVFLFSIFFAITCLPVVLLGRNFDQKFSISFHFFRLWVSCCEPVNVNQVPSMTLANMKCKTYCLLNYFRTASATFSPSAPLNGILPQIFPSILTLNANH